MKVYNNPGIFFEETVATEDKANVIVRKPASFGATEVVGAEMGIGAFIGIAPRGAMHKDILVTNWTEFVNEFGGFSVNSMLAYAVQGYFLNGGQKAHIVRTCKYNEETCTAKVASLILQGAGERNALTIKAENEGVWGNNISVEITEVESNNFTLTVYLKNVKAEVYKTSLAEVEIDTKDSPLIDVTAGEEPPVAKSATALTGGNDGISDITDTDYVNAMEVLKDSKFDMLAIPGITTKAVQTAMDDFCDRKGLCRAIKDAPYSMSPSQLATYRATLGSSARGRMVYPYFTVSDPIGLGKNPTKDVPPSGYVMGRMSQMIREKGAWNATAGIDAKINGILGLATPVNESDIAILNPLGITCCKSIDKIGVVIWGARTFSSDRTMKYANVRDTIDYIELSLNQSMLWSNFKGNTEELWEKIRLSVQTFLTSLWSQGGLKGAKQSEAFWVKCDSEINTQEAIDNGITYCDIGVSCIKPNEFTVFRLTING